MLSNTFKKIWNNDCSGCGNDYDDPYYIPHRDYHKAIQFPEFRERLIDLSINEDEINSHYTCLLDIISDSCVGTTPHLLGQGNRDELDYAIEDRWLEWCKIHNIGASIRTARRDAAKTGLGIMIPYIKETSSYEHRLCFKNYNITDLKTPIDLPNKDNVVNGIEYNEYDDIIAIYVEKPNGDYKKYNVPDEAIIWHQPNRPLVPECGPAFCLFPSVRRVIDAIVKGEELNTSIPMAVELDPKVYTPTDAESHPGGSYEYQPGTVPTLPPGTKLTGLNIKPQTAERKEFLEMVIAAAARCKSIPKNIILGDSSGHNMATAQIDVEPWKNKVEIDRHDFEPLTMQVFKLWYEGAVLISNYLPPQARTYDFRYVFNYKRLFSHPDPNKKASARMTDLISGSTTLYQIYTEEGKNPRRELQREANLLDSLPEEQKAMLVAARVPKALEVLGLLPDSNNDDQ